ncbi:Telomeric repeat-binding factor 1 [Gossypium arboreum]|uniref:Telomeric repeat-binding factor 1 n=2 Tax=Gossypium arboreum TaxID=29729 RepID=A0A0B0P7U1_GOSAR|nr:uncharacterized protein LOC108483596 [Gossypium arboreum]KAK5845420.1 hypothetical protein PVK06_001604 [Gossypium arboreum]KHG21125.1 Telomeric repeat-binding factor 1 [Gossypium arboreum]
MIQNTKKQRKGSISEEDISTLLQRYTATTVLALLQEVAQFPGVKLDWNALIKKTSTGISNAREYQMLWRHLAYRDVLLEKLEDGAAPLDDDSDLEYELEPCPSVSSETSAEAAACVKVLIASGLPNDSSLANSSMVDAPLTINIPNARSFRVSSENLQPTCSMPGTNITVPVSVQKKILPSVTLAETMEGNGPAGANLPARRKRKPWSEAEDLELIAAVQKCGVGNWANILRGDFKGDRTASQLAQRWTVIKKRCGNLNVEGNSAIPQLSEAQLATRSALSLALDMPDKNLTAACTNNPGLKIMSSSAPPTAGGEASVQAQSQVQQGPLASVEAQIQSQQGPIASVSSRNRSQEGPITSASPQNPSQQGPVASVQVPNQSQQGSMPTKTSPRGSSGSTLKSRVTLKKAPAKPFSTTGSILDATAVAAGARIGSPEAAASLLKAAQSKNAIHIMTTGGSSVKPVIPSGTSSQYVCTGLTAEAHSSPVTSSTLHPGSVKPATQRVELTSSVSLSINAPMQQCNAVTSGTAVEVSPKEDLEIKGSVSDSLPKEQVRENRAYVSKNERGKEVKDHKEALTNPGSELRNIVAEAEHPNEKLMVDGDQVGVKANPVEESVNASDSKDCLLVKKSTTQPTAEESCRNHSMTEMPAKASSLSDGCAKNLEVLSTAETGRAT